MPRAMAVATTVVLALATAVSAALRASARWEGGEGQSPLHRESSTEATDAEARALCTTCHLFPPPEILPRLAWRDEIARMALIRGGQPQPAGPPGTSGRVVQLPDDLDRVLRYYERLAPETLPAPEAWPPVDPDLVHQAWHESSQRSVGPCSLERAADRPARGRQVRHRGDGHALRAGHDRPSICGGRRVEGRFAARQPRARVDGGRRSRRHPGLPRRRFGTVPAGGSRARLSRAPPCCT